MKKIYYGRAVYDHKEINAVLNVLKNNSLSLTDGNNVKQLEKIADKYDATLIDMRFVKPLDETIISDIC